MEFFSHQSKVDFMGARKVTAVLSILSVIVSIAVLIVNGINFGLDFTGGTQMRLLFPEAVNASTVRSTLGTVGLPDVVVQRYGNNNTITLRMGAKVGGDQTQVKAKVAEVFPQAKILSTEFIGPQVGKQLATNGALALFIALFATAIYIAFRFEYRFAVSAAVALIHDPVLILGIFSFFHIEFDLVSLAAILTVIGYSLNDTIIVFDRIRENFRKFRKSTPLEVVNISVNQTLSRTIITSGLTLLAVIAMFFFGGETVHSFALAMIIGIVVGTYSSIYVAGALALAMGMNRQDLLPTPKELLDDRP